MEEVPEDIRKLYILNELKITKRKLQDAEAEIKRLQHFDNEYDSFSSLDDDFYSGIDWIKTETEIEDSNAEIEREKTEFKAEIEREKTEFKAEIEREKTEIEEQKNELDKREKLINELIFGLKSDILERRELDVSGREAAVTQGELDVAGREAAVYNMKSNKYKAVISSAKKRKKSHQKCNSTKKQKVTERAKKVLQYGLENTVLNYDKYPTRTRKT